MSERISGASTMNQLQRPIALMLVAGTAMLSNVFGSEALAGRLSSTREGLKTPSTLVAGLGSTAVEAEASSTAVSPSGEVYDPEALAEHCVEIMVSTGNGPYNHTFDNSGRIRGKTVFPDQAYLGPLISGVPGVSCPTPARIIMQDRLLIESDHLDKHGEPKYEGATSWTTVADIDNFDEGIPTPDHQITKPLHIFPNRIYKCLPAKLKAMLTKEARKAQPEAKLSVVRGVEMQTKISARSLDKSAHNTVIDDGGSPALLHRC